MRLIELECPNCGAQMQVNAELTQVTCNYCGKTMMIDPEVRSFRYENAEEAGYQFEKGRQRAREEAGYDPEFDPGFDPEARYIRVSQKDRLAALLLCIFAGVTGAHRFYVGRYGSGLLYLFTGGAFGIGWLYDIFAIATGSFLDGNGLPLK